MPRFAVRPNSRALISSLVLGTAAAAAVLPASPALAASSHATKRAASHDSRTARSASSCVDANLVPSPSDLSRIAEATLCLINQQRAAAGVPALRVVVALNSAATSHSADMVAHNYFDHNSPSGSTPQSRMTAVGYLRPNTAWSIGENIAAATGSLATPASIVTMWMNSSGHRANILDPAFRDTGIHAAYGVPRLVGSGAGGTYTEDFGVIH
jgi:uncharacterized protein YkwD